MSRRGLARGLGVLAAVAVAAGARWVAVRDLPPDVDELLTIPVAFWYAERLEPGRWHELPDEARNAEHPPLVKLLYAWRLRCSGAPPPEWELVRPGQPVPEQARPAFRQTRTLSAVTGVLEVAALALATPVGGLWLALDTYHVKFTSEAYLEGLPGLLALLAVLLFERALRRRAPPGLRPGAGAPSPAPLLASALLLGLTTAAKYPYGLVVALTMAPFLLARARRRPGLLALFAGVALATFVAADPALWPDPVGRLRSSVAFHLAYATGDQVTGADLPWWQPLVWLTSSAPSAWHPGVFLVPWLDQAILVVAALSLRVAWRERPVWVVWAAVGLAFVLAWPTKWPQYTLLFRAPLAGCAGLGVAALRERLSSRTWNRG